MKVLSFLAFSVLFALPWLLGTQVCAANVTSSTNAASSVAQTQQQAQTDTPHIALFQETIAGAPFTFKLTGTAKIAYQNNIFLSYANKQGGTAFIISPGIDAVWGDLNSTGCELKFYEDCYFYTHLQNINVCNANVFFTSFYQAEKVTADAAFSFYQTSSNSANVRLPSSSLKNPSVLTQALVHSNNWSVPVHVEYDFMDKAYIKGGFEFTATQYLQVYKTIYNNVQNYKLPVAFFYRFSDTIAVGPGYAYTYSHFNTVNPLGLNALIPNAFIQPAARQENYVNASFNMSPMDPVQFDGNLGWAHMHVNAPASSLISGSVRHENIFAFDLNLTWLATDKLSLTGSLNRGFGAGSDGQLTVNFTATVGAEFEFNDQWSITGSVNYTHEKYESLTASIVDFAAYFSGQTSNTTQANVDLIFKLSNVITIDLGYEYQLNTTNRAASAYMDNLISLSLGFAY